MAADSDREKGSEKRSASHRIGESETLRELKRRAAGLAAALGMTALLLSGCNRVTEEMLAARENGIHLLESGDYEGAIREFEALIESAGKVSDFELDVLKYRAEAEYGLGDFGASAYTYDILNQVDGKKAEYYYFGALAFARAGDTEGAENRLEEGKKLDSKGEKTGYEAAMLALGEAFSAAGDESRAEDIYQELITSGRATTEVYNRLMMAKMEVGDYEAALSLCGEGKALTDGLAMKQLRFNEAVCQEYLGQYEKALALFQSYVAEFGSDEATEHEIAFLVTR